MALGGAGKNEVGVRLYTYYTVADTYYNANNRVYSLGSSVIPFLIFQFPQPRGTRNIYIYIKSFLPPCNFIVAHRSDTSDHKDEDFLVELASTGLPSGGPSKSPCIQDPL